ncbi:MAG: Cysteine desulfurase SufS [Turneriella sp.]|nr:Cysteine desulfurase SufS [Turneriella sp.]
MADFKKLRTEFALDENLIWLNNCGISLPPKVAAEVTKEYLDAYATHGVKQTFRPHGKTLQNIQNYFVKLFGGNPTEYALLNNTAEGMTFIAQSLRVKPGDKILLVNREYPSNVYPFLQLKHKGIQVEFIETGNSNKTFLENIEKSLTPNVKAMSLSAVDWLTGLVFNLKEISALLKKHGAAFILDAAQGAGHVPIRVKDLGVDAMAFSGWKWLLGPLGSGALYVDTNFLKELDIQVAGTSSVKNDEVYLPHREEYKETAERFMLSTAPYLNWVFLESTLSFLDAVGFENVQKRLFSLAEYLRARLHERGFTLFSDSLSAGKSAIVVGKRDGEDTASLHAKLTQKGVVCALREGSLRFAPHLNTTEDDIDKLVKIISTL